MSSAAEVADLSVCERLLICQAVHDVGNANWPRVRDLLEGHPLWTRHDGNFFSTDLCKEAYEAMMSDEGHDLTVPLAGADKPRARVHVKLARKWFNERVSELRTAIMLEEARFSFVTEIPFITEALTLDRQLAQDIEEIRAGKWDDRLPPAESASATEGAGRQPTHKRKRDASARSAKRSQSPVDEDVAPEEIEVVDEEPAGELSKRGRTRRVRKSFGEDTGDDAKTPSNAAESAAEQDVSAQIADDSLVDDDDAADEATTPDATTARGRKKTRPPKGFKRKRASEAPLETSAAETGRKRVKTEDGITVGAFEDPEDSRRFRKLANQLIEIITREQGADVFMQPVTRSMAPSYHGIVKRPMAFKDITARIKQGAIADLADLKRDVLLICANACVFNPSSSEFVEDARKVAATAQTHIDIAQSAERTRAT